MSQPIQPGASLPSGPMSVGEAERIIEAHVNSWPPPSPTTPAPRCEECGLCGFDGDPRAKTAAGWRCFNIYACAKRQMARPAAPQGGEPDGDEEWVTAAQQQRILDAREPLAGGAPETAPLTMDEITEFASVYYDYVASSGSKRPPLREKYNAAFVKLADRLASLTEVKDG